MELNICDSIGVLEDKPKLHSKLGIALSTLKERPINGVRHKPENGTNGWYIWCGTELSEDRDFFKPLHIEHIQEYLPQVSAYLNLPTGYRFLIDDNGYQDIWFESEIKNA